MKTKAIIILCILTILCNIKQTFSQATFVNGANTPASTVPPDYLGWANTVTIPLDINHKGPYPINFYTNNAPRMTILGATNPGFVGIATSAPPFQLSVGDPSGGSDGGILAVGTYSSGATLPSGLTHPRMIWYPLKSAFRAGYSNSGEWDDANIGWTSAAFGEGTTASDAGAFATGYNTIASGQFSVAMGAGSEARANCSAAIGHYCITDGFGSTATGWGAVIGGTAAKAMGFNSEANGDYSTSIGSLIKANGYESFVIGTGIWGNCYLQNNIDQSLMVGFNSDVPTLFVSPSPTSSGGCGATHFTGNVGIGTTSVPQKLSVAGNINLSTFEHGLYLNNERFLVSEGDGFEWNTYLGLHAGPPGVNTNTGYGVICIGAFSGASLNSTEGESVFIGTYAGAGVVSASRNTYVGHLAGSTNVSGIFNVALGDYAGSSVDLDNENSNVMIGSYAGGAGEGNENVLIGLFSYLDGDYDGSIAIGSSSYIHGNNSVAIGNNANVYSDDAFVLGNYQTRTLMGYNAVPSIPPVDTAARLYVNSLSGGNRAAYFNGTIATVAATFIASDANLKNNIEPMGDVTSLLDQLSPKTYTFDQQGHPGLSLPSGLQYGLIAQDLETILPGLVETENSPRVIDTLGNEVNPTESFKAVNYTGLIPILIQGLKQQKERIDQLEDLINNCCGESSIRKANPSINVDLSNSIILNQNDPNPFAEETRITYNIPQGVLEAKIIFFDNSGHIIQTVKINERGEGQLNVFASNLTSGIYSYTLIADGVVVDTKKMVCNK